MCSEVKWRTRLTRTTRSSKEVGAWTRRGSQSLCPWVESRSWILSHQHAEQMTTEHRVNPHKTKVLRKVSSSSCSLPSALCHLAIREAGKGGGGDFRNFCRAPPPESGLVAPLGGARASCQRGGEQEGARGTNLKQWRTQRFYKFTSSLYLSHPNSQR